MLIPLHEQEFLALGLANFFGSIFNATATSGTFSRSAVCAVKCLGLSLLWRVEHVQGFGVCMCSAHLLA